MLTLRYKLWLEDDGKVFGKGPMELLKGVEAFGSLSQSAKHMNMSYTKAFTLIKDIESKLGYALVHSQTGGAKGGRAELTEEAQRLIQRYSAFEQECDALLQTTFTKYFVNE